MATPLPGDTIDLARQAPRPSLSISMETLHQEIENLHTLLTKAEDALCNVLAPTESDRGELTQVRGTAGVPRSPHGVSLDSAINKLFDVQRRLGGLIDRVDA